MNKEEINSILLTLKYEIYKGGKKPNLYYKIEWDLIKWDDPIVGYYITRSKNNIYIEAMH